MAKKTEEKELRLKPTLWRNLCWKFGRNVCAMWVKSFSKVTVWNSDKIPQEGPVMLISNHQSYLDPILIGIAADKRPFWSLAKSGLFDNFIFGLIIKMLSAIPVEQGENDIKAMRDCLAVLNAEQALMMFPEGARCEDGEVAPFEQGVWLLIKRSNATIVPAAIEGAFDVWPRDQKKPNKGGKIGIVVGDPISNEDICKMKGKQAVAMLQEKVEELHRDARQRLGVTKPAVN